MAYQQSYSISLEFKTTAANGILFFNIAPTWAEASTTNDYLAGYLFDGYVHHKLATLANMDSLASTTKKYNDGNWHTAVFHHVGLSKVCVDGSCVTASFGAAGGVNTLKEIHFLGIPSSVHDRARSKIVS